MYTKLTDIIFHSIDGNKKKEQMISLILRDAAVCNTPNTNKHEFPSNDGKREVENKANDWTIVATNFTQQRM